MRSGWNWLRQRSRRHANCDAVARCARLASDFSDWPGRVREGLLLPLLLCGGLGLMPLQLGRAGPPDPPAVRFPAVRVSQDFVHYPITGNDIDDLREQLRASMLPAEAGGRHGRTASEIEVRYELLPGGNGCRMHALDVALAITTTLPVWTPDETVPAALQSRWNQMSSALLRHEAVHTRDARNAAREARRRLLAVAPMADCRKLDWALQREIQMTLLKLKVRGERFDRRTLHGILEGTVL